MKKALATLAVIAVLFVPTGCASFGENTDSARLATQYATLKVIDGDVDRADRIEEIVARSLTVLDGGSITVAAVESAVRSSVDWSSLDAADTLLADALIVAVRDELNARVGSGVLDSDSAIQVRTVLEWVASAAAMV